MNYPNFAILFVYNTLLMSIILILIEFEVNFKLYII